MIQKYAFSENRSLYLFCGIKGLMRDGETLSAELNEIKPEKIYLSISPEEVEGLRKFLEDPFEVNLSDYEILYGVALSRYGEVMTPPPIYIEPMNFANRTGAELVGIDFPEEDFSRLYTETVGPRDLVMHSLRKRAMGKKRFPFETPEEFVVEWDRLITKSKKMHRIEEQRIEYMMNAFLEDFRNSDKKESMLIMEYEKCEPCREFLSSNGFVQVSV